MPGVQRFEDLIAWQKARALNNAVNAMVESETLAKRYAFRDQLQRAAVSVMSNIAEGFERAGRAEYAQMLSIAKGSCGEVRSLLYVAADAGYIDQERFHLLRAQAEEVSRLIAGLRTAVVRQRDADRIRT
ncbi:MAG: four helix bundle protein [Dehalococcoidia bacterium]|nr:four helix bundle protein [Dehalococcoidia bacterium]